MNSANYIGIGLAVFLIVGIILPKPTIMVLQAGILIIKAGLSLFVLILALMMLNNMIQHPYIPG